MATAIQKSDFSFVQFAREFREYNELHSVNFLMYINQYMSTKEVWMSGKTFILEIWSLYDSKIT